MFGLASLKEFGAGLAWLSSVGKGDAEHVKDEIQDLLQHTSQSLRTLVELSDTLDDVPLEQFNRQSFSRIANFCYLTFTSPDGVQRARTHCTDIIRDVHRIEFKMAKVLRAENANWKGIDDAFQSLMDADRSFLGEYETELGRIGDELRSIENLVENDPLAAWQAYVRLRDSLMVSRRTLSEEIQLMQTAQVHIHQLFT